MYPRIFLTTLVATFVSIMTSASLAQDYDFVTEGRILVHTNLELPRKTQRAFKKFARGTRFSGAFFVSADGRTYSYVTNFHNVEDAKKFTQEQCELIMRYSEPCILYATIEAVSKSRLAIGTVSISMGFAEFARQNVHRLEGGETGYIAVAGAYNGSWGISNFHPDSNSAIQEAKKFCKGGADKHKKKLRPKFVANLKKRTKIDFFSCEIISIWTNM